MSTAWVYLLLAGVMEWGWPMGLKFAWRDGAFRMLPALGASVSIVLSGLLLFLAQRTIPVGTAYAVWTGIGAIGTFALGILLLDEPTGALRFLSAGLIVAGIVGLKLSS